VNGAVHPAAAQQRRVGGIYDGIHPQQGEIALYDLYARVD
jgi:hypothetical protein